MTKTCPITSFRKSEWEEIFCTEEECALWDEKRGQCCFKTQALAAADTPSNMSRQAEYVYPFFTTTPAVIPSASGDWINPKPIDCQEDIDYSQVFTSAKCGALKEEFKL